MKVIIEVDHTVSCDEMVEAFKDNPAILSINIEGEHCGACTTNNKVEKFTAEPSTERSTTNTAMRKLLLDLQGYFNADIGADRYYRDYDLKKRINKIIAQLPQ